MKKILVIDDDELILEWLQQLLEPRGFSIATLQQNEGSLTIIELFKPDIILLDFYIGETTSFELAKTVKLTPATANIKIIFISVNGELRKSFREFFGDDFIEKPLEIPQLLQKIDRLCP